MIKSVSLLGYRAAVVKPCPSRRLALGNLEPRHECAEIRHRFAGVLVG
jgi:hypothetical protein